MQRIRFEPVDVEDLQDFEDLYNKLRKSINRTYGKDHSEIMPAIRTTYAIDAMGFPLDPNRKKTYSLYYPTLEYLNMAQNIMKLAVIGIIAVALIATIGSGYQQVDAGHRGVLLTFGAVDDNKSYAEGAHIVMPMVQEIIPIDVRVQKYVKVADSASKDLQTVSSEITVNHHPNPEMVQWIYKTIGVGYEGVVIAPAVEEVVKQVTAKYNAEELITKRPQVKSEITQEITSRLLSYNIVVNEVSITDFQFASGFASAIEAKVVVEQEVAKAKLDVLKVEQEAFAKKAFAEGEKFKKIQEAEALKQYNILVAEGQAEAVTINAEAEANRILTIATAEKDRIEFLAQAVANNPDFLTLEFIDAWNGKFPQTYLSSGGEELSMLLGIPNLNP